MASKSKLTPKQQVLKIYPDAYAYRWAGAYPWCIYAAKDGPHQGVSLNSSNSTAVFAWAEAASRLTSIQS